MKIKLSLSVLLLLYVANLSYAQENPAGFAKAQFRLTGKLSHLLIRETFSLSARPAARPFRSPARLLTMATLYGAQTVLNLFSVLTGMAARMSGLFLPRVVLPGSLQHIPARRPRKRISSPNNLYINRLILNNRPLISAVGYFVYDGAYAAVLQKQSLGFFVVTDAGFRHDHTGAAVHQFLVGELHIHHSVAFYVAQANHY